LPVKARAYLRGCVLASLAYSRLGQKAMSRTNTIAFVWSISDEEKSLITFREGVNVI
jgi:hypothetical protein